jgi:hypothetical protein
MMLGRKLKWNVEEEQILNDPSATQMMSRLFRAPYQDW